MSSIYWSHTPKTYSSHYDVIIVGAGYVGLSTSYWLKKEHPGLRIAIIEKDSIGSGASGRNAGFLTKGSLLFYTHLCEAWGEETALSLYQYAQDSINLAAQELDLVKEVIATSTSSWTFVRSDSVLEKMRNLPSSILDKFVETDIKEAAVHQHSLMKTAFVQNEEFSINPQRLLQLLEKKVKDLGVEFILGAQVQNIHSENTPQIETSFGKFTCDRLVLCTNGESYLLPELKLDIVPQRAQMLAMKLDTPVFASGLFYDPEQRVYFKFDKPGHLLIGGKRLVDAENENTSDTNVTAKIQDALYQYVREELKFSGERIASWAGTMGFTQTEIPYVGELNHLKSCYVAAGFSGHGMGWGFKTAHELSMQILGKINQPQLAQIKK
jgi:gamma-glutamylputrescine oxidase